MSSADASKGNLNAGKVNVFERNGAANIIMALQRLEKGGVTADKALSSIKVNAERLLRYIEQFNKAQASGSPAAAWHEVE
jgi:hypothetical protein